MDSSWNTDHFAHTDDATAGSALLGDAPCLVGSRQSRDRVGAFGGRINASRPDIYPADLLSLPQISRPIAFGAESGLGEGPSLGAESGVGSWWLVHTLPRQEKALAGALYARDVPYYLPLITRKSLSRGRTRVAQVTLFPGYVFVCGTEEDRLSVLKTNRALTVRRAPDGERLRTDLRRFHELISVGAPLLPEARLVAGERVRVKAGPFRDQEGVVIRRNGKTRLLIAVDYLQQGASLEVDDCLLERV